MYVLCYTVSGSTKFSEMLLIGDKKNGTDLHSQVSKQLGVTRDQAKVNYCIEFRYETVRILYLSDFKLR